MRACAAQVGTFAWAAPEVRGLRCWPGRWGLRNPRNLRPQAADQSAGAQVLMGQKCTEQVDIYSFGVILWCAAQHALCLTRACAR